MADTFTIKVKRWDGSAVGTLQQGEIAYNPNNGNLYIGTSNGVNINTLPPFGQVGLVNTTLQAIENMLTKTKAAETYQRKITSGTTAPSGGSDGDIYIQYQ